MKILQIMMLGLGFISVANAANITIYYSPRCPHCHHARDFFKNDLIYEYDDLIVTEVDATSANNRAEFIGALEKCKYKSGGVPVMVIGEKCFQGYGDMLRDDLRAAVEVGLTEAQKQSAAANRKELQENRSAFVANHQGRLNAIVNKDGGAKKN